MVLHRVVDDCKYDRQTTKSWNLLLKRFTFWVVYPHIPEISPYSFSDSKYHVLHDSRSLEVWILKVMNSQGMSWCDSAQWTNGGYRPHLDLEVFLLIGISTSLFFFADTKRACYSMRAPCVQLKGHHRRQKAVMLTFSAPVALTCPWGTDYFHSPR